MTGWASSIISPSRVTMTRSTPWVAGCCGPTLSVMSSVWSARSALSLTMMPIPVPSAAWKAAPAGAVSASLAPLPPLVCPMVATALLPWFLGSWPDLGLPGQQRELLAQRVAVEADAEQLGGLALVPVGSRPQVVERRQVPAVARDQRPELHVVPVVGGVHVQHHPNAGVLLVHATEEVEEVAGHRRVAPHELGGAAPLVARHRDGQQPVGDLVVELFLTELGDQVVAQGFGIHSAPTGIWLGS